MTIRVDISLASYRIEKPKNQENRGKIGEIQFFAYFSCIFPIFGLFFPYFQDFWFSYSVAGRRDVKIKVFDPKKSLFGSESYLGGYFGGDPKSHFLANFQGFCGFGRDRKSFWGTSKQHMKLQQPQNYDFRVFPSPKVTTTVR